MASVFISYASEDRDAARAIAEIVEARGFEVWWDRELAPGNEYADVIERELDGAQAVIVLWSENSRKSYWVRDEAAVGRDRNRLIPIALDQRLPPLGFRQIQTADLSGWDRRDRRALDTLWTSLEGLCGGATRQSDAGVQARAGTVVSGITAAPNNKSLKTILKEEKRQRSFMRTFWLTGSIAAGIMAVTFGFFAQLAETYPNNNIIVDAIVGGLSWQVFR